MFDLISGFIQYIVRPLFTEWHRVNPTLLSKKMLSHIEANYDIWQKTIEEEQEEKEREKENERPVEDNGNVLKADSEDLQVIHEPKVETNLSDDSSKPDNRDVFMDELQNIEYKKLSPVSEELVDFPGFNLRRHSLPPNMLLADTSCLNYPRRESFPCVEYSRRHSLPRNIYQSTSFDRLVDRLASVSEDPHNGRDFSVQGIEAKPKITTLSPSIETSRITSAYQKVNQEHGGGAQRYTITCTTIMRHRTDDENTEISPRTVIISTKMAPDPATDHSPVAANTSQQAVQAELPATSTFQTKPVLTSLPQNGSLHQKRLLGNNNINNNNSHHGNSASHSGENHVKTMDLNAVIPVVLTKGGATDSASMVTGAALKDLHHSPLERPKSLSVHTSGQLYGSGSHDRKAISGGH